MPASKPVAWADAEPPDAGVAVGMKPARAHPHRSSAAAAAAAAKTAGQPVAGARGKAWDEVSGLAALSARDKVARLLAGPFVIQDKGVGRQLELAKDELFLPKEAVKLRKIAPQADAEGVLREAEKLAAQTGVMPELVLYPPGADHTRAARRVLSNEVLLQTQDATSATAAAQAASAAGYQDVRVLTAPGYVDARDNRFPGSALAGAADLSRQPGVISATPLLAAAMHKKNTVPTDPLFGLQWHLLNSHQVPGVAGIDANVVPVWDTFQGTGSHIAIVDDGLQYTHPDLAPNYDAVHSYDFLDGDNDPAPVAVITPDDPSTPDIDETDGDWHGTSVGGVAAARIGNNEGGCGVAPLASLSGVRILGDLETDNTDASAMGWANDAIMVKSNSWGPADDQPWVLGWQAAVTHSAIQDAVTNGRGGKGIIFTWAGGNGRDVGDESNKDGYANCIFVNAVGAITSSGVQSFYSENGTNLVACAPSDGYLSDPGIVTTDLVGGDGYNPHWDTPPLKALPNKDYTSNFGGTSSATPVVAGVAALMLEANPNLGWRDVKEILLRSGRKLAPTSTGWVTRTGGQPSLPPIKHHTSFGGGLVDATAAVAMAQTWTPLGPMISASHTYIPSTPLAIPDNNITGRTVTLDFSGDTPTRVEHAEVSVNVKHSWRGDLDILLVSPAGTISYLATNTVQDDGYEDGTLPPAQRGYPDWTFSSVRHWGESSVGTWKVIFRDRSAQDVGTVLGVTVKLYGVAAPPVVATVNSMPGPVVLGIGNAPVTFGVGTTGYPDFWHQWSKGTALIKGQTMPTYTITSPLTSNAGYYFDQASNVTGTQKVEFTLGVVQPLAPAQAFNITTPISMQVAVGLPASTVTATYQWSKDGTDLANDPPGPSARISGVQTNHLVVKATTLADAGSYACTVTMLGQVQTTTSAVTIREKPAVQTASFPADLVVSGAVSIPLAISNGTTKVVITGLPSGLTYNPVTGQITGTPNVAVTNAPIKITPTNQAGTGPSTTINLTIAALSPNVTGTFNGLVDRDADLNGGFGGAVTNMVVASDGAVTGTLNLASYSYPFTGRLVASAANDPVLDVSVARHTPSPAPGPVALHLTIDRTNGYASGTVGGTVEVEAWHNPYSTTHPATGLAGLHNFWADPPAGLPEAPEGTTFGSATISTLGAVSLSLHLADGTTLVRSTTLAVTGEIPIYASLYANHGSITGSPAVTDATAPDLNPVEGALSWNKTGPASTADHAYTDGFDLGATNDDSLTLTGCEYLKPVSPAILWGLSAATAPAFNAATIFSGADIESAQQVADTNMQLRINAAGQVVLGSPNNTGLTFTVNPATGAYSGHFTLSDSPPLVKRVVNYFGNIVPVQAAGRGCFSLPGIPVSTSPVRSGEAALEGGP